MGDGADGTRLRRDMLDNDLFLEERVVRQHQGQKSFVLGVQLFVDKALVCCLGSHYIHITMARLVNSRDSDLHLVTVGYIPHLDMPATRSAEARRRASDARKEALLRYLEILLRRFIGASQTCEAVEFSGKLTLTAVSRNFCLGADRLGERSFLFFMGNA